MGTSGYVNSLLLKMAIEIVDFPIKNCDFPVRYVKLPEGNGIFKEMIGHLKMGYYIVMDYLVWWFQTYLYIFCFPIYMGCHPSH